jgi:DNA excision repair protein ERCC-2
MAGPEAMRFDDPNRTLELSVRDLVEAGAPRGDLVLETVQSPQARLAAGQRAHVEYQADRGAIDGTFQAEVRLRRQLAVGAWTVVLHGRVDGLAEEGGRPVVEEVKSTTLDAARLYGTAAADWPQYLAQLEVYLWMVAEQRGVDPMGRLVLLSLLDGTRHVIGVPLDRDAVGGFIRRRLGEIVEDREDRLAWLAARRSYVVPLPFPGWRPGQQLIGERSQKALDQGDRLLVEAPTGLGKTAAVLYGVLRHALAQDKQVFWATARTTQQRVVQHTLSRFREVGLPLRVVTITAKEKVCLNDIVACRPDRCPFAAGYFDRVRDESLVSAALELPDTAPESLQELAAAHRVCPYQLAADVSDRADVVVGDYNYVFDPSAFLRRHFSQQPEHWAVVIDEAHQLVERARGYASPRVTTTAAAGAVEELEKRATAAGVGDGAFSPFVELAGDIGEAVQEAGGLATTRARDGVAVAELSPTPWRWLVDRIDEVALDYARLKVAHPLDTSGDAWVECARSVLRFANALASAGEETVHLVGRRPGEEFVGLLCLDPSGWLGPRIAALGGFLGLSATLSPSEFYRDLFGLDPRRLEVLRVPSSFPQEHCKVLVAPRVSTAYRDRPTHADATAVLLQSCIEAVPGNVAVYFPSFEMLRDIAARWSLEDREVLAQDPSMSEQRRLDWLRRIGGGGPPLVLAAVLGGIFAEGIDLPPGALDAVFVAGPALPPVGMERDLLRSYYEDRYGEGFRYASLVPGLTRVVQAAGRLIRSPDDRGVIVLVGRRFRWRDTASLFPIEWEVEVPDDPAAAISAFWRSA